MCFLGCSVFCNTIKTLSLSTGWGHNNDNNNNNNTNNNNNEPIVRDADYQSGSSALVADLGVRGVWLPQAEALFDVRIVDTDAQSYRGRTPKDVLKSAEKEKKAKYGAACEERHALFTPLCCSVDGMLGGEAEVFVKVIGERLASKWDQSYSEVMGWDGSGPDCLLQYFDH